LCDPNGYNFTGLLIVFKAVSLAKHVVLVEPKYYTQYPPLGLLKLSSYHRSLGDTTELVKGLEMPRKKPDLIYVTSLFTWAWKPVWEAIGFCKKLYPEVEVWLGGLYASLLRDHAEQSGADYVYEGLFKDSEDVMPDYDLVPEWDGSIVFSSRGCIRACKFCSVPILEGRLNSVKYSIKHLIWPKHTRVIFFDNNILASPGWRAIFDELEDMKLRVDFNQGLDARLITEEVAEKLSKLKRVRLLRLAYDGQKSRRFVQEAIERLKAYGIKGREILVYALFNYEDHPEDFFHRIRDILEWGAVAYPMRFEPLDALEKNKHIGRAWDAKRLDMVQRARRVIGYGGAFPPYTGLIKKFEMAKNFDDAFRLTPPRKSPCR
jgi:hypothetical protein